MWPCGGDARMLHGLQAEDLSFAQMISIDGSDPPLARLDVLKMYIEGAEAFIFSGCVRAAISV
jgi:hypothetical protein